jgi:hypothetical protein
VHEGQRGVQEGAARLALHDGVVGGEQKRGIAGAQRAQRRLVAARAVVPGRDEPLAGAIADAVGQRGVDDDRGAAAGIEEPEVTRRVARQRDHFHAPVRPQPQRLAAHEPDVDGRVAAELALEEGDVLGRRAEPVCLVPAVVAGQHGRVGLDPRPVRLAAEHAGRRGSGPQRAVPAAVVDVGVGDQDVVEVAERAPEGGEVGRDHLLGHVAQPRVHEQPAVLAGEQVLAHVALAEVALDAVDARGDLHRGAIVCARALG